MSKRDGIGRVLIRFDPAFHTMLKRKAVDEQTTLQAVGMSLFTQWLRGGKTKVNIESGKSSTVQSEAYREIFSSHDNAVLLDKLVAILKTGSPDTIRLVSENLRYFADEPGDEEADTHKRKPKRA